MTRNDQICLGWFEGLFLFFYWKYAAKVRELFEYGELGVIKSAVVSGSTEHLLRELLYTSLRVT